MEKGNISNWKNVEGCTNLLFFAELVQEQLFYYSNKSNRILTLNSHFLCEDAFSAIVDIRNNKINDSSLKAIVDELYLSLKKDCVFKDFNIKPLDYFVKYKNGKCLTITSSNDLSFCDMKNIVNAINRKYFLNDNYLELLKEKIVEIVIENDEVRQGDLFQLTKSLLTELVNNGYNQSYIMHLTNVYFFNEDNEVFSPEIIRDFLAEFDINEKREYDIYFVAPNEYKNLIKILNPIKNVKTVELRGKRKAEKDFLN